jgi:hypothetical protein
MINNTLRHGNFTSSKIGDLMTKGKQELGFGAPAITYIEEKNMERKLGRSLTTEVNARPLQWGKHCETLVFDLLGLEYTLTSTDTLSHPVIDYWSGSPDGYSPEAVIDIKAPMTLKSFCQLVDPLYNGLSGNESIALIRKNHKEGDDYFWQLVSNAILTNKNVAELIVYMPYHSELQTIKSTAEGNKSAYWIWAASDDELPYLVEGGYYTNLNVIRFDVSDADKLALTENVKKAGTLLVPRGGDFAMAAHDPTINATIVSPASLLQKI